MLRLFGQPKATPFDAPIEVTRRVYAVGDVHGRFDLLGDIVDKILQDAGDCDGVPEVVFLGDYIDRGEHSREVLEFLITAAEWPEIRCVFLLGNHERMLLDFIDDPSQGARWLRFGGLQTLLSYGTPTYGSVNLPGTLQQIRDDLVAAMGRHKAFLDRMVLSHRNGNMLFAHASADPALPPGAQDPQSLLWGHPKFFSQNRSDGIWVTHGHTVVEEPMVEQGRVSVDTGAYFSNRLTAARFQDGKVRFLTP